jgi:hypothetical protein
VKRRMTAAMVLLALTGIGFPGSAAAAVRPPSAAPSYCTLNMDTGKETCFRTRAGSADFAGKVSADTAAGAAAIIIGRFYTDADFGGSELTATATTLCRDDRVYTLIQPSAIWQNSITSLHAYGNCGIQLFSGRNYDGDRDGTFRSDIANIGPFMNDRTNSIRFD